MQKISYCCFVVVDCQIEKSDMATGRTAVFVYTLWTSTVNLLYKINVRYVMSLLYFIHRKTMNSNQ